MLGVLHVKRLQKGHFNEIMKCHRSNTPYEFKKTKLQTIEAIDFREIVLFMHEVLNFKY